MSASSSTDEGGDRPTVITKKYGDKALRCVCPLPSGTWLVTIAGSPQIHELDPSKEGEAALTVFAGHEGGRKHHGGRKDGIATDASFFNPLRMCLMKDGGIVISDDGSNLLRLITVTPSGMKLVNTLAGDGTRGHRDGEALQAQFTSIWDLAYNPVDESILINDNGTLVRKYKDGVVSTVAGDGTVGYRDGPALQAQFDGIGGVGFLSDGSVAVGQWTCVRHISVDGRVSTIAGEYGEAGLVDGEGDDARFRNIWGLLVDDSDNIYVTDGDIDDDGVWSTAVRKLTKSGSSYVTIRDLEKQCVWYMQSSSNLECTVQWYILCKGKAGCDEVECMLEGKLVKNFALLVERHPECIDELEENGLLSSLLKQAYRSNVLTSVDKARK